MPHVSHQRTAGIQRIMVGNALDWPDLPIGAAATAGGLVWTAGVVSTDPNSGEVVSGDISIQTRRALDNLDLVLAAAGSNRSQVVLIQAFIADIQRDFEAFNAVYETYFADVAPPRVTIGASLALDGFLVELQAVAGLNPLNAEGS